MSVFPSNVLAAFGLSQSKFDAEVDKDFVRVGFGDAIQDAPHSYNLVDQRSYMDAPPAYMLQRPDAEPPDGFDLPPKEELEKNIEWQSGKDAVDYAVRAGDERLAVMVGKRARSDYLEEWKKK